MTDLVRRSALIGQQGCFCLLLQGLQMTLAASLKTGRRLLSGSQDTVGSYGTRVGQPTVRKKML